MLTAAAERFARGKNLAERLLAAPLGPACMAGDTVSVELADGTAEFTVISRRWVVSGSAARLELTLDHPARRAR
jgi:hypothetical protein